MARHFLDLEFEARLGFPPKISQGNFSQSGVISAMGIWLCFYDYGTENPRKYRGNTT
jgi:hypothetical protein